MLDGEVLAAKCLGVVQQVALDQIGREVTDAVPADSSTD